MAKKRRTKAEIQLERVIEDACNKACVDKSINIMRLNDIFKAAEHAATTGDTASIYAAAEAKAAELNESKTCPQH